MKYKLVFNVEDDEKTVVIDRQQIVLEPASPEELDDIIAAASIVMRGYLKAAMPMRRG